MHRRAQRHPSTAARQALLRQHQLKRGCSASAELFGNRQREVAGIAQGIEGVVRKGVFPVVGVCLGGGDFRHPVAKGDELSLAIGLRIRRVGGGRRKRPPVQRDSHQCSAI